MHRMRKSISLLAFVLFAVTLFAQTPADILKKTEKAVKSADGKKEKFAEAEKAIEEAMKTPELASGYELPLLKAQLSGYMSSFDDGERAKAQIMQKEYKSEFTKAGLSGVEALLKSMAATKDPKAIAKIIKLVPNAYSALKLSAGEFANAQDYASSYKAYNTAVTLHETLKSAGQKSPLDKENEFSDQLYMAGLLSQYAGDDVVKTSGPLLQKLLDNKRDSVFVYRGLYNMKYAEGQKDEALKLLETGRKKYPMNNELLFDEINHYLKEQKLEVLIDKLKEGIAREPKNSSLVFTLGNVYDNLAQNAEKAGDKAKAEENEKMAIEYYNKTLEVDSKNVDAIYSIGASFYNKAAKISQDMKKLESDFSKEGQKKYNDMEKSMRAEFDKALPFFQKAEAINANDRNTLIALKEIFAKKDDMKMSTEFKTRLEKVEGGGKNDASFFKN